MSLSDELRTLVGRYLDPHVPLHTEDTRVEPLIDGVRYFTEVFNAINKTGKVGDLVYITGLTLDRSLTLPGTKPIGDILTAKAAADVDVRLLLAGDLFHRLQANNDLAFELRALTVAGKQPWDGRVLVDWSGDKWFGIQHQKSVLVKAGMDVHAYVGGLELNRRFYDEVPHTKRTIDKKPAWGWHDAGVRLRGGAVKRVWQNFQSRWQEAATLGDKDYHWLTFGPQGEPRLNSRPLNPWAEPLPTTAPGVTPIPSPGVGVEILRSRFPLKRSGLFYPLGDPWEHGPTGGIQETHAVLKKAIGAAKNYIYIEDQYLSDSTILNWFGDRQESYSLFPVLQVAARRGVKLIFLGSAKTDPGDPGGPDANVSLSSGDIQSKLLDGLNDGQKKNVAVWRLKNSTVHTKLMIIDDEFAAIGSANLTSRSMYGVDAELHVAIVDANKSTASVVRRLRIDLWAEHLRLAPGVRETIATELEDIRLALGIWRSTWLPQTIDRRTWRSTNHPEGFDQVQPALELVGPPDD